MVKTLVALAVQGMICWAGYQCGKHIGSWKGYAVGRAHGLRRT